MSECNEVAESLRATAPIFENYGDACTWVRQTIPGETSTVTSGIAYDLYFSQVRPAIWKRVTEERYDDMLNVLPPLAWVGHGFLVGEAWDQDSNGTPRFTALLRRPDGFFESLYPLSVSDWRWLDPSAITIKA